LTSANYNPYLMVGLVFCARDAEFKMNESNHVSPFRLNSDFSLPFG